MTTTLRRYILRGNAFYIFMFGCAGMLFDIRGVLFGLGPQGRLLADVPYAGITFVESHGLAVGDLSTTLHLTFAMLNLGSLITAPADVRPN